MTLSNTKQATLDAIVYDLQSVDHIAAIVLGGSHSTGMANENSDLDLGIYYHEAAPFDIEKIKNIAQKYHTDDSLTVTGFYQWGAWVNGGAWINTVAGEVDFVYRNIEQVKAVIEKSKNGIWENDFEQQPPYGFSSVIYLAETHYCQPLYDPQGIIQELKNEVKTYPPKLKQTIIQQALWAAEFTLWQAKKFAQKGDLYNAIGCFTRAMKKIVDALFALNELYPIGDKHALQMLARMPKCPDKLNEQIDTILAINKSNLASNAKNLRELFEQIVGLTEGKYHPYFVL